MPSTFFGGGTIWTGVNGQVADALLVVDGVVGFVGERARELATGVDEVDLGGGFLMASFADGHAHPLPGGLEAVGPQVRQCVSVDEIVDAVRKFAAEHPDDEWIVGDRLGFRWRLGEGHRNRRPVKGFRHQVRCTGQLIRAWFPGMRRRDEPLHQGRCRGGQAVVTRQRAARADAPHPRRQFELRAAAPHPVDGVVGV
jgi:hypothetical protein